MPSSFAFRALPSHKQLARHVLVGMGSASVWRGAWYMLDDHLFPDDQAKSAAASLTLGTLGMAASQGLVARAERMAVALAERTAIKRTGLKRTASGAVTAASSKCQHHQHRPRVLLAAARFGALYTVAWSVVLIWRGTWLGWDLIYESLHAPEQQCEREPLTNATTTSPTIIKSTDAGHLTRSGLLSHFTATCLLLASGLFASVLAPPAAASIIRDTSVRGPAQRLARQLFASGNRSNSIVVRRNMLSTTTRRRRNHVTSKLRRKNASLMDGAIRKRF
ncbi:hypothetical protein MPSEU_000761500 [Mayamaea pseudoterrestris]|nr:hypothetical protein MPSEU_000761500 [Mayamaea pseudoterrestris]